MSEFNYSGVGWCVVIVLLLMAMIGLICPPAHAYPVNITDQNISEGYERITQGSIVYLDETYDISGVTGWATSIAWYGTFAEVPDESVTIQTVELPNLAHTSSKSQYYFTIDNATFGKRLGHWFQYYSGTSDDEEEHGNLEAFYVYGYRPVRVNQTNVTGVISYNTTGNETVVEIEPPAILPEMPVSDYLVARGCNLSVPSNTSIRIWLFGRINGLYGRESINDTVNVGESLVSTMEPGSYKMMIQTPTISEEFFTVRYVSEDNKIQWFDPSLFSIGTLWLDGLSPYVCMEKLQEIFTHSKDEYEIKNLVVQDPMVSINRRDTVWVNGTSVLDIRGYTNSNKGTIVSLVLDPEDQTARTLKQNTYYGEAQGDIVGNLRYYQIYIPIYPDRMYLGMHTIKATTEIGGEAYADFPISELPADSYIPNATVRYVGDRNPWVPTPTPIIKEVVKVVPGPTITVIKEITPSQDQTNEAQKKATESIALLCFTYGLLIVAAFILGRWVIRMYLEARR